MPEEPPSRQPPSYSCPSWGATNDENGYFQKGCPGGPPPPSGMKTAARFQSRHEGDGGIGTVTLSGAKGLSGDLAPGPASTGEMLRCAQHDREGGAQSPILGPRPSGYVELHCHSNYSMLDGASHPEDLIARAKELGMEALAITDHDGLYGAVRFWQAATREGIHPIIGSEVTLEGGYHLTLLAKDRTGYANLCRLISASHLGTGNGVRNHEDTKDTRNHSGITNVCLSPGGVAAIEDGRRGTGPRSTPSRLPALTPNPQPLTPNPFVSSCLRGSVLPASVLARHAAGLICLSGCRRGEVAQHLLAGKRRRAREAAERYLRIFGTGDFWTELQHHLLPEDDWLCGELAELAGRLGVGCVATNNVHYAAREAHRLQDILVAVKNRTTLEDAGDLLRPNFEYHLKSDEEMDAIFRRYPGAVANSGVIAERCRVDLDFKGFRFPGFRPPQGETSFSYLYRLCHEGARERYRPITPAVSRQLAHELDVIHKTGLAEYFLIVWDIMRFARERRVPGQGRGSAADSLVAYVLGITKVDPLRHNLLFERFLSEEMTGMPDIDIDFSTNHREEIIQYVYEKYGREHTGMVCNVVTYRARNALREVGKAMGIPIEQLNQLSKLVNSRSSSRLEEELSNLIAPVQPVGINIASEKPKPLPRHAREGDPPDRHARAGGHPRTPNAGKDADSRFRGNDTTYHPSLITHPSLWRQVLEFCRQIEGFPRHLSIHVGGMLITAAPLVEIAPLQPAAMPGRVVVQFNKDDVEDMGLIKMDLLGLRTLSVIFDAVEMIRETRGIELDLDSVPLDDPAVYDLLCEPDNIGVFQVESRAQSQTLPKMRPRSIEDLIVEISIIRPGPLQGNMVHPYLRRRQGLEEVTYLHPSLEPVLAETLGVVLFQEQVIRVAVAVAGFTAGEADLFRRAMNRHRSVTEMERIRLRFLEGALRQGLDDATAETIFRQLAGFASYGFCKSHAAAFAKTAYDTAYLKRYYAPEFYTAILNNQPMGFYSPEVVVNDARRHGIRVLPVDVNLSRSKCAVEGGDIRLGFGYVHGLGEAALARLEEERLRGPYGSVREFIRRTGLSREALENLTAVGAMDCFGRPRREMLWEVGVTEPPRHQGHQEARRDPQPLTPNPQPPAHHSLDLPVGPPPALPALTPYEETAAEYSLTGVSTGSHAVELFRKLLDETGAVTCGRLVALPRNLVVRVGGLVVCEQAPPTARGYVFLTLEDETGLANAVVRPQVYSRFRRTLQTSQIVLVEGVIQRESSVTNLIVRKVSPLNHGTLLETLSSKRPHRR
jgi:error-prone DNA polymerase